MRITTDRIAKAVRPNPKGERRDYAIGGSPGLQLRVSHSVKVWSLIYRRPDGKQARIALGEYPAVSLREARLRASEARTAIKRGLHPTPLPTPLPTQPQTTFQMLAEMWIERHAKAKRRSWKEAERILNKDAFPAFGCLCANAITRRDIIAMSQSIHERNAPILANRAQSLVGTIFSWGVNEDIVQGNPVLGLRKRAQEQTRDRYLSPEEIQRFWHGLEKSKVHPAIKDILRLCLLMGQRVNEIARAAKSEFDLANAVWTIPKDRTKNGRAHRLPIPTQTMQLVQRAMAETPQSLLVFPSPAKGFEDTAMAAQTASHSWRKFRESLGLDNSVHDLRRTFSTLAGDLGFEDFHIGLVLNHTGGRSKVTSIYNRSKYDGQKREILNAVERRIFEIVAA